MKRTFRGSPEDNSTKHKEAGAPKGAPVRKEITEGNWTEGLSEWVIILIRRAEPVAPWEVVGDVINIQKNIGIWNKLAEIVLSAHGMPVEKDEYGDSDVGNVDQYARRLDMCVRGTSIEQMAGMKVQAQAELEIKWEEERGTPINQEMEDYYGGRGYINWEVGFESTSDEDSPSGSEGGAMGGSEGGAMGGSEGGARAMASSVWEGEVVESMVRTIEMIIG